LSSENTVPVTVAWLAGVIGVSGKLTVVVEPPTAIGKLKELNPVDGR